MGEVRKRQLEGLVRKQKKIARIAKSGQERAEAFGFWAGFINGLKMTGAITQEEYIELYEDMIEYEGIA